jgi:Type I phosphodiesterase / nucleotide pyrophosphatase
MTRGRTAIQLALCLAVLGLASCNRSGPKAAKHNPVAVIGGDGLEWSVLRPLLLAGKMPNLKALIERGTAGYLHTAQPTLSPILWTTIATGRHGEEHGIRGFFDESANPPAPYTSEARRGKALWNIASDYGLRTLCVGWWISWPAEEINGYMVAPYIAAGQKDQNWKGNFSPDVPDQTWPRDLVKDVLPIAERFAPQPTGAKSTAYLELRDKLFAGLDRDALDQLASERLGQTMWSAVADATYTAVATTLLARMKNDDAAPDLVMVYAGGTDVSSHRYWKFAYPSEFRFEVPGGDVSLFGPTIERFYRLFDEQVGAIVATLAPDTNVIVCSDHGFHAAEVDNPESTFSGHHGDAPPGVFIACGPDFVTDPAARSILDPGYQGKIPSRGKVVEIAPLVLYLLGIPIPQDFRLPPDGGLTISRNVKKDVLAKRPPNFSIFTHDIGFRKARTSRSLAESSATSDMHDWLKQNGYPSGAAGGTEENNPKPDDRK